MVVDELECEREATEPNYFEGLRKDLPKGVLTACQIDITGTGRNTQSLMDEVLQLKYLYKKGSPRHVDKLGVVFDRDSFSHKILIQQSNVALMQILAAPGVTKLSNCGIYYISNIMRMPCFDEFIRR